MNDLDDIYRRLAVQWTHEQLAANYRTAERRGASLVQGRDPEFARPIPLLARAIPPTATVSVAIHVLHALPNSAGKRLPDQLIETAERNAADALHRCHHALELDGKDHGYTVEEWLPTVYDIAISQLESTRLDQEPPTVVRQAQEAISWLSRAIVELDGISVEATAAITEAMARLLTVWLFAGQARYGGAPDGP